MNVLRRPVSATLLAALLALASMAHAHAAGTACPPLNPWHDNHDCPPAISTPRGYPTQGGTVAVHAGEPGTCTVRLPGGVLLCAGGDTAQGPNNRHDRAIFRISGSGPDSPGGLNIFVSAAPIDNPNAAETLHALDGDALVYLPPHTRLLQLVDTATLRFMAIPNGHLRHAGLYKVVAGGVTPIPQPAAESLPATLPDTGSSPFGALVIIAALLIVAGAWIMLTRKAQEQPARPFWHNRRARAGLAIAVCGVLLALATGLAQAYIGASSSVVQYGTLAAAAGPLSAYTPSSATATRLNIERLGIDTPVVTVGIANGTWQVPSYAAGALAGTAGPGTTGNAVITGHDDADGSIFQRLGELREGDSITVYAGTHAFRYRVTALRVVAPARVDVLQPTRDPVLTLITCTPYLIDSQRLIVQARLANPA